MVSYAILFKNIFSVDGVVNQLLLKLNLIEEAIPFVLDKNWAKVVIIFALIWILYDLFSVRYAKYRFFCL